MAVIAGARSTATDSNAQRRQIDDQIENVSPKETPFLKLVGINGFVGTNPKYEWEEDALLEVASTVADNPLTAGATTLNVAAATGPNFQIGNILKIESEYLYVTAVAADALTVVRGVAGSVAASHNQGTPVDIVGIALNENTDSPAKGTTTFSFPFNYFQLFDAAFQVSDRQNNTNIYGMRTRDYDYQVGKTFKELAIKLERACFHGQRAAAAANVPQMMGGIEYFITQNVKDLAGAALSEKDLNDSLQDAFYKVGLQNLGRTIICGAWLKRKISSFYAPYAQMRRSERRGGVVVDTIETEFGDVDVLGPYIWAPKDRLYIVNLDFVSVGHYKGGAWYDEPLPANGPYKKGHVAGDYTMCVKNDKAHMLIKGVSTTS